MLRVGILWIVMTAVAATRCFNNSDAKYSLMEEAELVGYHSVCSQFAGRTCCSLADMEAQRKKQHLGTCRINKYFSAGSQLSQNCRTALTTLMCVACDGDIGTRRRTTLCQPVCQALYNSCKNDYFIVESGKFRPCSGQDPVCSNLQTIVQGQHSKACEVFDIMGVQNSDSFVKRECWDGRPSWVRLGKANKKVTTLKATKTASIMSEKATLTIMLAAIALAGIGIIKYMRK